MQAYQFLCSEFVSRIQETFAHQGRND